MAQIQFKSAEVKAMICSARPSSRFPGCYEIRIKPYDMESREAVDKLTLPKHYFVEEALSMRFGICDGWTKKLNEKIRNGKL